MKPSVYLETTIVSYFCSRPSPDIIINAHQQITRQWGKMRIEDFGYDYPILCIPEELL
jgi:hypothetical protein